jgi:hypothetical protein
MSPERRPEGAGEREGFTLERVIQLAKETALAHGGHVPMLILNGSKEGVVCALDQLPETSAERQYLFFRVGVRLAHDLEIGELQHVFFVSEGWMSVGESGRPAVLPPSGDPQRREVLLIFRCTLAPKHTDLMLLEMVRNRQGKLVELREWDGEAGGLPRAEEGEAESPLLDAFLLGYLAGRRGAVS